MRHSIHPAILLGVACSLALGACWKKNDDEQPPAMNAAPVSQQQQPVQQSQAQQQPQQAPAPAQQQVALQQPVQVPLAPGVATPQSPATMASIAQPIRPETIIVTRKFKCKNDTAFTARFMHNPHQVEITFDGRVPVTLPQDRFGSGFTYKTSAYQLIGKGNDAQWIMKGKTPVNCSVAK